MEWWAGRTAAGAAACALGSCWEACTLAGSAQTPVALQVAPIGPKCAPGRRADGGNSQRRTSSNGLSCSAACNVTPLTPSSSGATRRSPAESAWSSMPCELCGNPLLPAPPQWTHCSLGQSMKRSSKQLSCAHLEGTCGCTQRWRARRGARRSCRGGGRPAPA